MGGGDGVWRTETIDAVLLRWLTSRVVRGNENGETQAGRRQLVPAVPRRLIADAEMRGSL